ncbi:hypothetical protein [uncultured Sphingomonas sp.]|uniref:hypothetical protein n=1 Tax=uncultured Sphingomonas sp. TaxID=158754 RepID=UPI0035CA2A62
MMMAKSDYDYFKRRAETELEQARRATDAKVATTHRKLAEAYRARAASLATTGAIARDAA